jgi:hypothetical protein
VFWVISVYFNIRNTLPKFFTFLPGHPVYIVQQCEVPCDLGSTQPLKMSTRLILGGKGGRCGRLTTYHLHVPMSRNMGALTSWNPVGLFRPVMGQLYLLQQCEELTLLMKALHLDAELYSMCLKVTNYC